MTLCGLSLFVYVVSTVSTLLCEVYSDVQPFYSAKYLYAQHVYEWTTAQEVIYI